MSHLRAWVRIALFLGCSAAVYLVYLATLPVRWIAPRVYARVHAGLCRLWARGVARVVGLDVHVEGPLPEAPFVLVSNHLGYLDIVTLMTRLPAVFVSRADVQGWPVLGRLSHAANTIYLDRSLRRDVVRVNGLISDVLASGRGLVIFPEGTSSDGESVLPFHSSLLEPAARIGHPVSYATLGYRTPTGWPPAAQSVCWWGDMTFLDHFYGLLRLPRIDATVSFGTATVRSDDRHELARRLHDAVAGQLSTLTVPEARWA